MSSDDVLVQASKLGKAYRLYAHPQDRLKHTLLWRFGREYGKIFWAVKDISFELRRGEMLGVVGRNGSGKSTLLQMLAGTLYPTEGTLQTNGRITALLELGSGFNYEFNGRENIYLNAAVLGFSPSEIDEKVDDIIAFADIGSFIDQPVKLYSSGMFVRLAFAVTTGLDPDILLVDEALAVGDVFFRQKCHQRLSDLRDNGTAVVYVSHNLSEIEQYCDSAILLSKGQVHYQGNAPETVRQYYFLQQAEKQANLERSVTESSNYSTDLQKFSDEMQLGSGSLKNSKVQFDDIEIMDETGDSRQVFQQGETAQFVFSFTILDAILVPISSLAIKNQYGITVHGKSAFQFDTILPDGIEAGLRIVFRQFLTLDIAIGEYTVDVGLAEMSKDIYSQRSLLPHESFASHLTRISTLVNIAKFGVTPRRNGRPAVLMHYGLCDLPSTISVEIQKVKGHDEPRQNSIQYI